MVSWHEQVVYLQLFAYRKAADIISRLKLLVTLLVACSVLSPCFLCSEASVELHIVELRGILVLEVKVEE